MKSKIPEKFQLPHPQKNSKTSRKIYLDTLLSLNSKISFKHLTLEMPFINFRASNIRLWYLGLILWAERTRLSNKPIPTVIPTISAHHLLCHNREEPWNIIQRKQKKEEMWDKEVLRVLNIWPRHLLKGRNKCSEKPRRRKRENKRKHDVDHLSSVVNKLSQNEPSKRCSSCLIWKQKVWPQ